MEKLQRFKKSHSFSRSKFLMYFFLFFNVSDVLIDTISRYNRNMKKIEGNSIWGFMIDSTEKQIPGKIFCNSTPKKMNNPI